MRNFKKTCLSLAVVTSLSFSGCGSSSTDNTTTQPTTTQPTTTELSKEITVERGATYDANVTDANGQVAIQKNGENVYIFATTPKAPIIVSGGWIDVNGNGELDTNDTMLSTTMSSYSNTVTPVSTYISDSNETIRNARLQDLANITGVSTTELQKVASKANTNAILTINALYQEMLDQNTTNVNLNNVRTTLSGLQNAVDLTGITDPKEIAKRVENKTIENLLGGNKISRVSYNNMDELQKLRIFGETWKVRKVDARYLGNKVVIDNDRLVLSAKYQDGNNTDLSDGTGYDSIAELRAELKTKIDSFSTKVKVKELDPTIGKLQVNGFSVENGSGFLTGITIKYDKIYFWIQRQLSSYPTKQAIYLDTPLNSTKIATAPAGKNFLEKEFNCTIGINNDGFDYNITNLDTNETYSKSFRFGELSTSDANITQAIAIWNDLNSSEKKFNNINIRVKNDNRTHTYSGDTNISNAKMHIIDLNY